MGGEAIAIFIGLTFTAIVITAFVVVFVKIAKSEAAKKRMEEYKQRVTQQQSGVIDDERRRQEELKQRLAQKYGLNLFNDRPAAKKDEDEQQRKHQKHVEDSHAHGHVGEEEHYEEIIGSLGEVNDEGCADLSGVRFLVTDLSYELQDNAEIDYDRIAQAMVLGDIVNNPRFKSPYARRK